MENQFDNNIKSEVDKKAGHSHNDNDIKGSRKKKQARKLQATLVRNYDSLAHRGKV